MCNNFAEKILQKWQFTDSLIMQRCLQKVTKFYFNTIKQHPKSTTAGWPNKLTNHQMGNSQNQKQPSQWSTFYKGKKTEVPLYLINSLLEAYLKLHEKTNKVIQSQDKSMLLHFFATDIQTKEAQLFPSQTLQTMKPGRKHINRSDAS